MKRTLLTGAVGTMLIAGCGSGDSNAPAGSKVVKASISDAGCSPATLKVPAGPTTFDVTNEGSASVTEYEVLDGSKILGEVENIGAGLSRSFSLTLQPGEYTLYCPHGDDTERGKLVVTGKATANASDGKEVAAYRSYLEQQSDELVSVATKFAAAVKSGDVAQAKQLFANAREPYERIEPVAETFGSLDPKIDARAGDVPASQWRGFHRIEKALWVDDTTKGQERNADQLVADVKKLRAKVAKVKLEPAQIANGANELLGEVSKSKVTGEEDRYSHTDLWDFQANVDGAQKAFEVVAPLIDDQQLVDEINQSFAKVDDLLAEYKQGDGFVSYTELTAADTRKLSQAIDVLAEQLSEAPAKTVAAGSTSN